MDRLSEVLEFVGVTSVVSGGSVATGRWRTESVIDDALKFIALVRGSARLCTDGVDGVARLVAGDVAVLNGRSWLRIDGGDGDEEPVTLAPPDPGAPLTGGDIAEADVMIGGRIELDRIGRELVLHALPPLFHARSDQPNGAALSGHVRTIFDELRAGRPGSEFALRHHGQLLVLEIVRGLAVDPELPAGWLAALGDDRLRPALELMHAQPGRRWGLADLARAASMSRSSFAERFRLVVGAPPLTYLHDWRMLVARRALRTTDTPIRRLARDVGYASESAFSTAFKSHVGRSPAQYRASRNQPVSAR